VAAHAEQLRSAFNFNGGLIPPRLTLPVDRRAEKVELFDVLLAASTIESDCQTKEDLENLTMYVAPCPWSRLKSLAANFTKVVCLDTSSTPPPARMAGKRKIRDSGDAPPEAKCMITIISGRPPKVPRHAKKVRDAIDDVRVLVDDAVERVRLRYEKVSQQNINKLLKWQQDGTPSPAFRVAVPAFADRGQVSCRGLIFMCRLCQSWRLSSTNCGPLYLSRAC
jgi:hypothetical protein